MKEISEPDRIAFVPYFFTYKAISAIRRVRDLTTDLCCPKKKKENPSAISRKRNSWLKPVIWVSEPRGKHWEMAHWKQKLMNWNKHKRKKANQWRCKYYHATAETQQQSQLLQPDKRFSWVSLSLLFFFSSYQKHAALHVLWLSI